MPRPASRTPTSTRSAPTSRGSCPSGSVTRVAPATSGAATSGVRPLPGRSGHVRGGLGRGLSGNLSTPDQPPGRFVMRRIRRLVPSPALVVACLALAVGLAGTGYAVTRLPRNSVTTVQVKDFSLLARDFKRGQL